MANIRIHTAAKRKASKKVTFELSGEDALISQLKELDHWVRNDIAEKALSSVSQDVLASMRANVPDSASTGSRSKMSQKAKSTWSGSKKLKNTLTFVIRRSGSFVNAFIGPDYKAGGGHGNLFSRDHKRSVFWGRDGGGIRRVNQFVKKAADETAAKSKAKMIAILQAGISDWWKRNG
jgi:hypothetical protein